MKFIITRAEDRSEPEIRVVAVRSNYRPKPHESPLPDELISLLCRGLGRVGDSMMIRPGEKYYRQLERLLPDVSKDVMAMRVAAERLVDPIWTAIDAAAEGLRACGVTYPKVSQYMRRHLIKVLTQQWDRAAEPFDVHGGLWGPS